MSQDIHAWIREMAADGRRWHKVLRACDAASVVAALGFEGTLRAAYQMLYNERGMTRVRELALDALDVLREREAARWNADWRHEAFYALIADRAQDIERRNAAWDRAFNLAAPEMTVEFAFLIARTTYNLDNAPVNLDEAMRMLEATMDKKPAAEAAGRLAMLCRDKGDREGQARWQAHERELTARGQRLGPLLPPPLEGEHYLGPKAC